MIRALLFGFIVCLGAAWSARAQYVGVLLKGTDPEYALDVPDGQVLEVLNFTSDGVGNNCALLIGEDRVKILVPTDSTVSNKQEFSFKNVIVPGPQRVFIRPAGTADCDLYCSYRVYANDGAASSPTNGVPVTTNVPLNAVVIPENAAGPVQVSLEASTDMVNWVAINPGQFGAGGPYRFFRVRAVSR